MRAQHEAAIHIPTTLPMRVWYVTAFACAVWGTNFITMKWATELVSPMQVVLLRVLFGFLPVAVVAILKGVLRWEHLKHTHHYVAMSLLATVIYYYGFASGTALLDSGIAGAISAAVPIFTMLCTALFLRSETISLMKIFATLLGFSSILLLVNPFESFLGNTAVEGALFTLLGALSVGSSFVYARRFLSPLKIPPLALTTYQLGIGLVWLFLLTDLQGLSAITADSTTLLTTSISLGLLGTGCTYLCYYYLIDTAGAVFASSITYIPPVIALFIGAFLVGEDITVVDFVATALIMLSVLLISFDAKISLYISSFFGASTPNK